MGHFSNRDSGMVWPHSMPMPKYEVGTKVWFLGRPNPFSTQKIYREGVIDSIWIRRPGSIEYIVKSDRDVGSSFCSHGLCSLAESELFSTKREAYDKWVEDVEKTLNETTVLAIFREGKDKEENIQYHWRDDEYDGQNKERKKIEDTREKLRLLWGSWENDSELQDEYSDICEYLADKVEIKEGE